MTFPAVAEKGEKAEGWPLGLDPSELGLSSVDVPSFGIEGAFLSGGTVGYVLRSATNRNLPWWGAGLWSTFALVGSVLALPWFWAFSPLKRGERRAGGWVWNVLRGHFLLWTVFLGSVAALGATFGPSGVGLMAGLFPLAIVWGAPVVAVGGPALVLRKGVMERGPTGPLTPKETGVKRQGTGQGISTRGRFCVGCSRVGRSCLAFP